MRRIVEVNFTDAHGGDRILVNLIQHLSEYHHQVVGCVAHPEEVGNILAGLAPVQGQFQHPELILLVIFHQLAHRSNAGVVHIIEQYHVSEPVTQPPQDIFGNIGGLAVETDCMKPVRRQTQHVLLAAGDEKNITTQRKLIETERVMFGHFSGVQEPKFGIRHVELGKPPSLITKNRFLVGAVQLISLTGFADALVSLNGNDVVPGQHLPADTVLSPEGEFRG